MKIFSEVKEIGEEDFSKYLSKYGREYAECYLDLGSRSYQANGSRVVGTIMQNSITSRQEKVEGLKILDIASGPEMLKSHIGNDLKDCVTSMDINVHHFAAKKGDVVAGSFGKLPIKEKALDYANLSLALHYTKYIPSRKEFERLEVLAEINRVLKENGRAVINMIYSLDFKNEEQFKRVVNAFGFEIVDDLSGQINIGKNYQSRVVTLEKKRDIGNIDEVIAAMDKDMLDGLKFRENKIGLKDSRKMFDSFALNNTNYDVNFNTGDAQVYEEERAVQREGEALKRKYKDIENIPKQEVLGHNFVRLFVGNKYILFKRLEKGNSIVVVK